MTNAEAFNCVWQYFIVERHPQAIDPTTRRCCYRTSDGNKCAAGCLIPDELYSPDWETSTINHIRTAVSSLSLLFEGVASNLLAELQHNHDSLPPRHFHHDFERKLRDIAKTYHLAIPT